MGKPQSNFQYRTIFGVPLIAGNNKTKERRKIMSRGRKAGQEVSEPIRGYITITDNLRVRVESDCLTVEEKIGVKDGKVVYGNYKYLTSWDNLLSHLVKRFTAYFDIAKKRIEEAEKSLNNFQEVV